MLAFLDTNIILYALMAVDPGDRSSLHKRQTAQTLLIELSQAEGAVISSQVMSEFFVNAIRKGRPPMDMGRAAGFLSLLSDLKVEAVDADLVQLAAARMQRSKISYWDALIVEAAIRAGSTVLYSEDLQHGMCFDSVQVRNPFLPQ